MISGNAPGMALIGVLIIPAGLVCMYVCMYVCVCVYMFDHTCRIGMHVCMYVFMYTGARQVWRSSVF